MLERDVARDAAELLDDPGGAGGAEAALERRHAADHALDHEDILALAVLLAPARVGAGLGAGGERAHRTERGDRTGDLGRDLAGERPGRRAARAAAVLAAERHHRRPRARHAPLGRHDAGEELGEQRRVDELAGAVAPLQLEAAEVGLEIARGLVAIVAVEGERLEDDALERLGQVGRVLARRRDGAGLHLIERLLSTAGEERARAGELVEHDAGGEHVGAAVDRLAAPLLGRHVRELALHHALFLVDVARARDAEVDDLHRAVPRHQHVLRGDVAVDDAERLAELVGLAVRVVEALGHLLHDVRREPVGDAALLSRAILEQAEDVEPLDVLHRQEVRVADRAEVEDLDDVRVIEPERDLGLVDEHGDELARARVRGMDLLDDQGLGQALRDGGAREIDLGHPTGADLPNERVFTELFHHRRAPGPARPIIAEEVRDA